MSHPILEIRFEFYDKVAPVEELTRYWYHIPRVGDSVRLRKDETTELAGIVDGVKWMEEWIVVRVG